VKEHALALRAEESFLQAWPALRTIVVDGWLLRFADGLSRRANSVNPLSQGQRPQGEKVALCESYYRAAGQPAIFRLAEIFEPALDDALETLGYGREGESETLYCDLSGAKRAAGGAELAAQPNPSWLAALAAAASQTPRQQEIYRRVIARLRVPAVFAVTRKDGEAAGSVAYGALHGGLVVVESVATAPACRRQGLAKSNLNAILAWAQERGADGACLQMEASNGPARALYAQMGFDNLLYRYHYRRKAPEPAGIRTA
jgi:GNAT superfamily N-acetyltransferase